MPVRKRKFSSKGKRYAPYARKIGKAAGGAFRRLAGAHPIGRTALRAGRTIYKAWKGYKAKRLAIHNKGRREDGQQLSGGSSITTQFYAVKSSRPARKLMQSALMNKWTSSTSQQTAINSGKQVVDMLGRDGPAGTTVGQGLYSTQDIKALVGVAATLQVSPGLTTVGPGFHILPFKGKIRYVVSNASTAVVTVWFYDIVPRQNITNVTTAQSDPIVAWRKGSTTSFLNSNITDVSAIDVSTYPYSTPFASREFTEWYRVIGVKKVVMAAGVLHEHVVTSRQVRWIDSTSYLDIIAAHNADSDLTWRAKSTILTMIVALGMPVQDTTGGDAHIETAALHLDILTYKEYKFKVGSPATPQFYTYNDVPQNVQDLIIPEAAQAAVAEALR